MSNYRSREHLLAEVDNLNARVAELEELADWKQRALADLRAENERNLRSLDDLMTLSKANQAQRVELETKARDLEARCVDLRRAVAEREQLMRQEVARSAKERAELQQTIEELESESERKAQEISDRRDALKRVRDAHGPMDPRDLMKLADYVVTGVMTS